MTQERWRQYLLGQTENGSNKTTLKQAIKDINSRISTFYDGDKATRRVAALELPAGTKFSYENLAPRDSDGHANAAKPEVYDRLQVYLNRRPGSTFSSVSLLIQEFAGLYGESKLLRQLANPGGLTEESAMQANIALGLNALMAGLTI